MTDKQLIDELEKWRAQYDFNFQIWSEEVGKNVKTNYPKGKRQRKNSKINQP
jgi:hypothetical protein